MIPNRKSIFLKAWLWSLIGAGVLVALFWLFTDVVHVLQSLNSLTDFTNIVLSVSVIGNILGAGLVTWRVADRYFHEHLARALRNYWLLSLLSVAVAALLIFVLTPLTPLIAAWNVVAPLCTVWAIQPEK